MNGRSFTDLLALQAGVIPASSAQPNAVVMSGATSTPPSGDLNPGNMSVSGQRETANGFVVNGSSVEEDFNNGAGVIPNLDSISEFRVLTSGFDAEYGNFSGGQVLVVHQGRNQPAAWQRFRIRPQHESRRDQLFGPASALRMTAISTAATVGGPVIHDRLFFFGDYQGTNMTQGVETGQIAVPSMADRSGNLMDQAAQLNGKVSGDYLATLLSQKLGRTVRTGEPYYSSACTSAANDCAFPNAVIPDSRLVCAGQGAVEFHSQAKCRH